MIHGAPYDQFDPALSLAWPPPPPVRRQSVSAFLALQRGGADVFPWAGYVQWQEERGWAEDSSRRAGIISWPRGLELRGFWGGEAEGAVGGVVLFLNTRRGGDGLG